MFTYLVGCEEATIGYGDSLIASGLARGAADRGKRIAFGNKRHIVWTHHDFDLLSNNPNVAAPGQEKARDIEWIEYYRGHRLYGTAYGSHWRFHDFKCIPGEIFFTPLEAAWRDYQPSSGYVVIEPRVKSRGACVGVNKQWPIERYQAVADELRMRKQVVQFVPPGSRALLRGVDVIETPSFRYALAALTRADLYIGPEGGLHHGAAALGVDAVVIFGGFNTPRSTGYPQHINITVGEQPCGSVNSCPHCRAAMASITVERVLEAANFAMRRVPRFCEELA